MNKIYTLTLALTLTACSSPSTQEITMNGENNVSFKYVENPTIQATGMEQIKGLLDDHLKPALMPKMKKDPSGVLGMKLCSESAKGIENAYNENLPKDSMVRRTALKYRNPANKPDAIDVEVMTDLQTKNNFNPVVIEMKDQYRVYKALPTLKPCLACHGDTTIMDETVKEIIAKKYPTDLATNFKEGEFRGVVVSEIKK